MFLGGSGAVVANVPSFAITVVATAFLVPARKIAARLPASASFAAPEIATRALRAKTLIGTTDALVQASAGGGRRAGAVGAGAGPTSGGGAVAGGAGTAKTLLACA